MGPQKRRKLDNGGQSSSGLGGSASSDLDDLQHQELSKVTSNMSLPSRVPDTTGRTDDTETFAQYSGDSYKSSIFKLQTNQMLSEVQTLSSDSIQRIDIALRTLKATIESIEEIGAIPVNEAMKVMQKTHKISIPFPEPKPDQDAAYKLSYAPPSNINVIGSYALKTMIKGDEPLAVDLVVTMPASIFQQKDYLNYRYFYKRAYYLACVAAGLQSSAGDIFDLKFGYLGGNTLQTVLVATLRNGDIEFSASKFQVNITPAAPEGFFDKTRLHPTKNCIRPKADSDNEITTPVPTPFYNATLRTECNFAAYLKLLHHTSKHVDGFREACILGQIWLRQRGLGSSMSKGGFGNFEWAALMALLLQGGGVKGQSVLSPSYNSYQLFKGLIQFLSSNELADKAVLFKTPEQLFETAGNPVFFDGPRAQNILFKMTPWSYAALHKEAIVAFEMLNDVTFDQFESTFILRKDHPLQEFDLLIQVPSSKVTEDRISPDYWNPSLGVATKLYRILNTGLTDRVSLILIKVSTTPLRELKASASYTTSEIQVGILFNPTNMNRLVDHGPAAEEKGDAAKFRSFWGEKAELRRFKDGSILESIVWPANMGSTIVQDIVSYLLRRHFGTSLSENSMFVGDCFRNVVPVTLNGTKAFEDLMEGFRSFEQHIRDLDALPLQLKQLSAASAQLRYSSTILPILGTHHHHHQRYPADVIIQFEGSGRWPDDIAAIQRTKIAFLLKIGHLLESNVNGLTTRLGIENSEHHLLNCAFLDVLYPSGPTFRLRIHNEREHTLLDRQIRDKSASSHTREAAAQAKSAYIRTFVQIPLHSQSVSTLCTRFPLLSPTIRLLKKWFESHMISSHFKEEFIELLVIRTFLQPYPWQVPSSSTTGFLRTLQFMSRWNWRTTPLIVDFNGTMGSKEVDAIQTRLEAWRKIDPAMNRTVLLAASNHDSTGTTFTEGFPSKVVAARMTALARSACAEVKRSGLELDPMALFKSTTVDYDFVIHLTSGYTGSSRGIQDSKPTPFKNLEVQPKNDLSIVGYEPTILFLEEIRRLYATSAVFFHDAISNLTIAGLWNPQTFLRTFKVNVPHATRPLANGHLDSEAVEIDKSAILLEIARLGGNMVAKIEVRK